MCVLQKPFYFFFLLLLLFGGNTIKLFISTIKGVCGGLLSSYPKGFLYLRSTHFGNRHFSNPWVSFPKCFHTSAPLCPAFLPYHHLVLMKNSSLQPCQVPLFFLFETKSCLSKRISEVCWFFPFINLNFCKKWRNFCFPNSSWVIRKQMFIYHLPPACCTDDLADSCLPFTSSSKTRVPCHRWLALQHEECFGWFRNKHRGKRAKWCIKLSWVGAEHQRTTEPSAMQKVSSPLWMH